MAETTPAISREAPWNTENEPRASMIDSYRNERMCAHQQSSDGIRISIGPENLGRQEGEGVYPAEKRVR